MTEGLFVLTTLFVAYVIYVIVNEKKTEGASKNSAAAATQTAKQATVSEKPKAAAPKPAAVKSAAVKPAAAKPAAASPVAVAKPVATPKPAAVKTAAATKPAATKPAAVQKPAVVPTTATADIKGSGLKDPKTGEIATTYSNYRFTKRWIKEALVTEKLVEKVYKNDELNASVEAKIKDGIAKLEAMKKYKP